MERQDMHPAWASNYGNGIERKNMAIAEEMKAQKRMHGYRQVAET